MDTKYITVRYILDPDGLLVGCLDRRRTAYAYPTSIAAEQAAGGDIGGAVEWLAGRFARPALPVPGSIAEQMRERDAAWLERLEAEGLPWLLPIGLTDAEARAVLHRLAVPGSIAEALADPHPDGPADFTAAEVEAAAQLLAERLERCRREGGPLMGDGLGEVHAAVLADCVEGSTWAATTDNPGADARARQTLYRVRDKLRAAGVSVGDPPAC